MATQTTKFRPETLDGARLIRVIDDNMYVWHGGVTFNVYSTIGGEITEVTCFENSTATGEPLSVDEAEEAICGWHLYENVVETDVPVNEDWKLWSGGDLKEYYVSYLNIMPCPDGQFKVTHYDQNGMIITTVKLSATEIVDKL